MEPWRRQLKTLEAIRDQIEKEVSGYSSFRNGISQCPVERDRDRFSERIDDATFRTQLFTQEGLKKVAAQESEKKLQRLNELIKYLITNEIPLVCSKCNKPISVSELIKSYRFRVLLCEKCYKAIMSNPTPALATVTG